MKKLEKRTKNRKGNNRGITLIALVITIIILLILAGISIAMLTGQNGILNQANKAKKMTEEEAIKEQIAIAWTSMNSNYYKNPEGVVDKSQYFTLENFNKEIGEGAVIEDFTYNENGVSSLTYKKKENREKWYIKIKNSGEISIGKTFAYQIAPQNYGDKIQYSANGVDNWKIFYTNGENVFIISSDYVPNSTINIENTGMVTNGNYSVYWENIPSMQENLHNKLFMANLYTLNKEYNNSKCVSTLLNTENWKNFTNIFSDYAIGGSTIEMWCASWNEKYPSEKIYCNNVNEYGYFVGIVNKPTNTSIPPKILNKMTGFLVEEENNVYFPHKSEIDESRCWSYWLSSPNAHDSQNYIANISYFPYIDNNEYTRINRGIRPVVCLKSNLIGSYIEGKWIIEEQ